MPPFPNSRITPMASRPPPSFFSLMLDTSATTLKISTEFVTKHLKNKIPKSPIIICANGGHSWRIKIKKVGENYYFDSGWTNVVKDVHFMFGDFVLFRLVDKYTFKMFVYGKNSCERSLPKKVKVEDDDSSSVDNVVANVDVANDDDVDDSEDDDDDDDDSEDDDDDDDSEDDDVYEGKEEEEEVEDDDDGVVDIDGDDGDPFFISTISKAHKRNLRLPDEFVELAGIEDERSIMLKNLDGEEWRMELRPEKVNQSERLFISSGWAKFQHSNDLWEGDECVFKFITSEGKILLAKVSKKKRPARQSQPSGECSKTEVVKRKRGRELHAHGRDVDVESEDECMEMVKRLHGNDDDDEHEDSEEDEGGDKDEEGEGDNDDVDGNEGEDDYEEEDGVDIDGNPFFKLTILKGNKSLLRLPEEFVGLPGIKANGTIMLKNLKGEEWRIGVLLDKSYKSERYLLSAGWVGFLRSNDISVGDECILKFIRKESKLYLAKVTKKQRPAWQPQPSGEILATVDVKRKRGRPRCEDGGDVESEDDCVELVKRPCGEDNNDEDNYEDKDNDINEDDNHNDIDGEDEDDGGGGGDIDGDPFFVSIISRRNTLRLPGEFVRLPGINANETIMLKNLKGEEWRIRVLLDTTYRKLERYILSAGMLVFMRRNDILVGDECVIKFIRNEGKLCLAKVTKKNSLARQPLPSSEILATTEVVKRNRGQPVLVDLGDVDVKNEDERVEVVKRSCGEDHDEEDDGKDDGEDNGVDNGKDTDNDGEDDKDGDVGDPSFSTIISKCREVLLPEAFAGLPGIKAGGTIILKNLTGEECPMGVRLNTRYQKSKRYVLSAGWAGFLRSNGILVGDECVIKLIRNEGKLCLTKVTKKNSPTRQAQPSGEILVTEVVKRKRGQSPREDLGDMDVENEDECVEMVKRPCVEGDGKEDDEDDDDGQDDNDDNDNDGQDDIDAGGGDIDGDVGDPSFATFFSTKAYLALPAEFVGLPGIEAGGSIMMKNLKGEEWSVGVRLNKAYKKSVRYVLTAGCREFLRGNNISDSDECVFKFIRNEGKLCLAKVTKNKRQLGRTPKSASRYPETEVVTRQGRKAWSTIEIPGTEVVNRKRGLPSPVHKGGSSRSLGRKRGQPQSPVVDRKRGAAVA